MTHRLISIDPGADNGWAIFEEGILAHCGLGDSPRGAYSTIVIERPHPHQTHADRADIITLAIRAGRQLGLLERGSVAEVFTIEPATWKGQTPKKIHNARVLNALYDDERDRFRACTVGVPASKLNNVIDAIGIGRWALTHPLECAKFRT
jgi:hypothetical protein